MRRLEGISFQRAGEMDLCDANAPERYDEHTNSIVQDRNLFVARVVRIQLKQTRWKKESRRTRLDSKLSSLIVCR